MRRLLLAPLLTAALTLTGCSEDPKPKRADSSDTPAATDTPTESPSASTDAADKPETPRAFLKRWRRAEDTLLRTGNASQYRAMSAPDCEGCARTAELAIEIHQEGEIEYEASDLVKLKKIRGNTWQLTEDLRKYRYRPRDGAAWVTVPPGVSSRQVVLVKNAGEWAVSKLTNLPTEEAE